jgi:hypothetical protein
MMLSLNFRLLGQALSLHFALDAMCKLKGFSGWVYRVWILLLVWFCEKNKVTLK